MLASKLPRVGTTIFTVMSQLAAEHGAVNLGQGFPDFEGPSALHEALIAHLRAGKNQYAPMAGVPALRRAIAAKVERCYGRSIDPEHEVTVLSGASEGLFGAVAALVRPGDEVIVLDPCYDSYEPAIELQGAHAVHVPLRADDYSVDWAAVDAALGPKTRMIITNTPHNPSGAVWSAADLEALAARVVGRDIAVLADEVYEHIVFDGREHQSVLRHPELARQSLVVSSFGKTYHITGWKIGYCVAPPELTAELRKVHQFNTFCTFHAAQWAIADFMTAHPEYEAELAAFYQAKRDRFLALLRGTRFRPYPVAGAYFQLVDYSAYSDLDDVAFCRRLTERVGVAAIPLSAFYAVAPAARVIRFCFAKTEATLAEAARRLARIEELL